MISPSPKDFLVSNYSPNTSRGLLRAKPCGKRLHFILSAILWDRCYYYVLLQMRKRRCKQRAGLC